MTTSLSQDVINKAREALGTPYQHQGRLIGLGLDCIGLAAYIAKSLGLDYIDGQTYGHIPHGGLLEYAINMQPCLYLVNDMSPGDLILMRYGRHPQHVAIFTGATIVHAFEPSGRVVENRIDDRAQDRITHSYRFKRML